MKFVMSLVKTIQNMINIMSKIMIRLKIIIELV